MITDKTPANNDSESMSVKECFNAKSRSDTLEATNDDMTDILCTDDAHHSGNFSPGLPSVINPLMMVPGCGCKVAKLVSLVQEFEHRVEKLEMEKVEAGRVAQLVRDFSAYKGEVSKKTPVFSCTLRKGVAPPLAPTMILEESPTFKIRSAKAVARNENPVKRKSQLPGNDFSTPNSTIDNVTDILCTDDALNAICPNRPAQIINLSSISASGCEAAKLVCLIQELGRRVDKLEMEKVEAGERHRQLVERVAQLELNFNAFKAEVSVKNSTFSCTLSKDGAALLPQPPSPSMTWLAPPPFKICSTNVELRKQNPTPNNVQLSFLGNAFKKLQRIWFHGPSTPSAPSIRIQAIRHMTCCRRSVFLRVSYLPPSVNVILPRRLLRIWENIDKSGTSATGSVENDVSCNLTGSLVGAFNPIGLFAIVAKKQKEGIKSIMEGDHKSEKPTPPDAQLSFDDFSKDKISDPSIPIAPVGHPSETLQSCFSAPIIQVQSLEHMIRCHQSLFHHSQYLPSNVHVIGSLHLLQLWEAVEKPSISATDSVENKVTFYSTASLIGAGFIGLGALLAAWHVRRAVPPVKIPARPTTSSVKPPTELPLNPPAELPLNPPAELPLNPPAGLPLKPAVRTPLQPSVQSPVRTPVQLQQALEQAVDRDLKKLLATLRREARKNKSV